MRDLIKVYQNSIIKQASVKKKNKKWVIVCDKGVISLDAFQPLSDVSNWVKTESLFPTDVDYKMANQICYFKGKYYVSTKSKYLFVSEDLTNWTAKALDRTDYYYTCIACNNEVLIIGFNTTLMWSTDGENWTTKDFGVTVSNSSSSYGIADIEWCEKYNYFFFNYRTQQVRAIEFTGDDLVLRKDLVVETSNLNQNCETFVRMDFSGVPIVGITYEGRPIVYSDGELKKLDQFTSSGTTGTYSRYRCAFNFELDYPDLSRPVVSLGALGKEYYGDYTKILSQNSPSIETDRAIPNHYKYSNNTFQDYKTYTGFADWDLNDTILVLFKYKQCNVFSKYTLAHASTNGYWGGYNGIITTTIGNMVAVKCLEVD